MFCGYFSVTLVCSVLILVLIYCVLWLFCYVVTKLRSYGFNHYSNRIFFRFGPNGGLVFCMEYLIQNTHWLEECLGEVDDDYFIIDCPGQIEIYTHLDIMGRFVATLEQWDIRLL